MATHPVKQPDWIDTAPILVSETIEIDASPDRVWTHIADHTAWPEWFEALDEVRPGATSTGVGGTRQVVAKPITIDEQFTAWDEGEHFAFAIVGSKLPMLAAAAESVRLESIDGGRCRVTYRQGVEGRRGLGWLMKLAWTPARKGLPPALAALKQRVEADTTRT
ncbi:MAG: SRPBCC family protein [Ilumatobacter sp.]|uniref:SRPBCC family protein n=1 Tax=Ilumatobacter sp. TaxID=1967498 RepID=UPI0032993AED